MKKYLIEIPLKYNRNSNLDRPDSSNDLDLNFDKDINLSWSLTITKGKFELNEKCHIKIYKENEEFLISMDSLYADNEEYAIDIASNLANKVCYVVTYLVQSQNVNIHYFHPKFSYRTRDIRCKEGAYERYDNFIKPEKENGDLFLHVSDSISFRDSVHTKMIYSIKTELFDKIFDLMSSNKHLSFVIESYYRALGEIDYISKYYNLFTIIEYIESNFKEKSNAKKMFNKDQKKELVDIATSKLNECFENNEECDDNKVYVRRVSNRFSQILSDSTDKTRTEKLYTIIKEYFKIEKIEDPLFNYEITESKLKKFIDTRNSLFHAKKLSEDDIKQLSTLTNELMVLCKYIIKNIISM